MKTWAWNGGGKATTIAAALALAACTAPAAQTGVPATQDRAAEMEGTTSGAPDAGGLPTTAPVATTDSTPPTTEATRPPNEPRYGHVAVVGCSQTRDAVQGFNAVGNTPIFGPDEDQEYLSAGTVDRWAANSGHWRHFSTLHQGDAAIDAVWIMLCWHAITTDPSTSVETVEYVIDRALEVIGHDVPVFVSGLNDWEPRAICRKADWEASWELAHEVVAAGVAMRGPELGPITEAQTTDGCHGNADGNAVMGAQLASFFLGGE